MAGSYDVELVSLLALWVVYELYRAGRRRPTQRAAERNSRANERLRKAQGHHRFLADNGYARSKDRPATLDELERKRAQRAHPSNTTERNNHG